MRVVLTPHPQDPPGPLSRIEVEVDRIGQSDLRLRYRAFGDLDRVLVPGPTVAGRADDLWRQTCFEAFVMPAGGPAYLELNFAPSSQWASYRFDGERTGMALAIVEPRGMHCLVPPGRLELTVDVDLGHLAPTDEDAGEWRLGLSAVIEDIDHVVSYWALTHPSDKPDFHHPDSFTLVLPATEPA